MNSLIKLTLVVLALAVIANGEKLSKIQLRSIALSLFILILIFRFYLGRARQNFNCDRELNDQIQLEFDASQIYLSLVNY